MDSLKNILNTINAPIIFWANIGSTADGTIDDIREISSILKNVLLDKYKLHADGAIYGLLVPYLDQFKHVDNVFTHVDTLSISGHKFLGSYSICGMILAQKSYMEQVFLGQDKKISYVSHALDYTVSGSRSGYSVIELYLLLQQALAIDASGKTNLEILWMKCLALARWLHSELCKILVANPLLHFNSYQLSIVFPAPKNEVLKHALQEKYMLMPVGEQQLGIYVFPQSRLDKLEKFLADYKNCIDLYS